MEQNRVEWKKIITTFSLVGLMAFLVFFIISRLDDSVITITSENDATIFLVESFTSNEKEELGQGEVSVRLNPGIYTFIAENELGESRTTIETDNNDKTINLPIMSSVTTKEVASVRAKSININSSNFNYVDTSLEQIFSYSSPKIQPKLLFPSLFPVVKVEWSENGDLVELPDGFRVVRNNSIRNLNYPPNYKPQGDYIPNILSYDVSQNGRMVFNFEGDVYYYNSPTAKPKKVYSAADTPIAVSVSNSGHIALFNHPDADSHSGNEPFFLVVDSNGDTVLENQNISVSLASISSGGEYVIYDDEAVLKRIAINGKGEPLTLWARPELYNDVQWVSDVEYIIYEEGNLYLQNVENGVARKLTEVDGRIANQGALDVEGKKLLVVSSDFNRVTPDKIYEITLNE